MSVVSGIVTGALRTSPSDSIPAEAHNLPPSLRQSLFSGRCTCKVQQLSDHPFYQHMFSLIWFAHMIGFLTTSQSCIIMVVTWSQWGIQEPILPMWRKTQTSVFGCLVIHELVHSLTKLSQVDSSAHAYMPWLRAGAVALACLFEINGEMLVWAAGRGHAFARLISLQPHVRLTSGFL